MAGLPYNCRCFTVTGNVAGMPNPPATRNGGSSSGSGGSIVPGVRGACSPSGPVFSFYPPSDIVAQGFGANVSPDALIGNGTNIFLTGSPFTITSSGCYTIYMQSGGGGGGGVGSSFSWCSIYYVPPYGYAPAGPGGIGGVGVFSMISLQLLAGDLLTYSVGSGGNGAPSGNPNGQAGSNGTPTTATITRNGQTVYYFFAPGGAGGQGGNAAGGSVPSNGFQGSLIPGPPGNSGNGGVGIVQQGAIAGVAGVCSAANSSCFYYTFSVTGPSGAADWFGNPGRGFYGTWNCQNSGTTVTPAIRPFGNGYGGSGAADGASSTASTNGGNGFILLVKYS